MDPTQGFTSEGFVKMHDPEGPANNQTTVAAIPTRADHSNSEDGVLGMSLEPDFDLSDPTKRDIFIYYSPRDPTWPTSGNAYTVGHNLISRFTMTADGTGFEAGSERPILEVPKVKLAGNPSWCAGCPGGNGPGHVGGAGLVFDSNGDLYLGVGDDVSPNEGGHGAYPPLDYRAQEHRDARKTSANSNDLRGKIVRIHPLDDIPAGTTPGVGQTYSVPDGNMFAPGTANTRPEIYAMGFRQPFTLHTDPANPGTVAVGEYCHDAGSDLPQRAPAGGCEWNLLSEPGFHGWPFCVANNSAANTSYRWDYATGTSTGNQYDCSLANIPTDLDYAPAGQSNPGPTFDGLANLPGPAVPATIWKKTNNQQPVADFGNLQAGGNQPITGPIYRYDEDTAGPGAFPAYYDGSWLINNRGSDNGFWKEVRLREDNNQMLHVHDWLPYNAAGSTSADFNSLVIGTRFGPDGALYMGRFSVGCCRNEINAGQQTQIVKVEFNVQDECLADEQAPNVSHELGGIEDPENPGTYVNGATMTIDAEDVGCAGIDTVEYRVNSDTEEDWVAYEDPVPFEEDGEYSVDYRATDDNGNVSEIGTATFTVVTIEDNEPPTVTAEVAGTQDQRGFYLGSADLALEADDGPVGSGVDTIEYRVNSDAAEDWQPYSDTVVFDEPGLYEVDYRATDLIGNASEPQTMSLRVIEGAGCVSELGGDEFNGTEIGSQWLRHTRSGGTPTTGDMAPFLEDGQLVMRTNDFELDASSGTTALGPVNFLGIDLPALGDEWQVETQFTVQHTGGWQHTGLIVWQADNNFFRSTITNNLTASQRTIYVEQSKDNPSTTEGARVQAGGNVSVQVGGTPQPITIKMRYTRPAGSNSVTGEYQIVAPESLAMDDWANFPATNGTWNSTGGLDLNPAAGARRDSAGSRIGIIAGGNFPGTTGPQQYNGDPAEVNIDYFRVIGGEVICEEDAPTTTATLDPPDPGEGGTYTEPVTVDLSADDAPDDGAAGVDFTEYRVITDGEEGEWQTVENTEGDDPFASSVEVSTSGENVVEFRSTDRAANAEETKSISFSVELPGCLHSDEFDGTELNGARWPTVRMPDGFEASVEGGQLVLPVAHGDINEAVPGPISYVAQPVPDGEWEVTTKVTMDHSSHWQHGGLMIHLDDDNYTKLAWTQNNGGNRFLEFQTETNGSRQWHGDNVNDPGSWPNSMHLRLASDGVGRARLLLGRREHVDRDGRDRAAPGRGFGHRRQRHGRRGVGADRRLVRLLPDDPGRDCGEEDTTPPVTTAQLNGAPPVPSYEGPVTATLTASDEVGGSGVESTEYRVNGGDWTAYNPLSPPMFTDPGGYSLEFRSTDVAGNVEEPPGAVDFTITEDGGETTPPETTATLDPAAPGPGGTYDGPVDVTLSATDPDEPGSDPETHQVTAIGFEWDAEEVDAAVGDTVAWDFNNQSHDVCIDDSPPEWSEAFGDCGDDEVLGDAREGDPGGEKTFGAAGAFGFYCSLHEPSMRGTVNVAEGGGGEPGSGVAMTQYRVNTDGATGEWQTSENTAGDDPFETAFTVSAEGSHVVEFRSTDVAGNFEETGSVAFSIEGGGEEDVTAPETTASLEPAAPGPGGTYEEPVDTTLSATDAGVGRLGRRHHRVPGEHGRRGRRVADVREHRRRRPVRDHVHGLRRGLARGRVPLDRRRRQRRGDRIGRVLDRRHRAARRAGPHHQGPAASREGEAGQAGQVRVHGAQPWRRGRRGGGALRQGAEPEGQDRRRRVPRDPEPRQGRLGGCRIQAEAEGLGGRRPDQRPVHRHRRERRPGDRLRNPQGREEEEARPVR